MEQMVPNIVNISGRVFKLLTYNSFRFCSGGNVLKDLRATYKAGHEAFLESHLSSLDPMEQFGAWFQQIRKTPEIPEPNAMCISTVNKDGAPSSRFVLLKSFSSEGFKFFTNTHSRKGQDLAQNPKVALNFYWAPFHRQVRVEGTAERLPDSEAVDYFESRPFKSQVGSAASDQSKVVPSRDYLVEKAKQLTEKYENTQVVPKPPEWGGYLVVPHMIEFWQGQDDRLHDRIVFKKLLSQDEMEPDSHPAIDGWIYQRLSP